jgi:histidinol-phosphatase (PHP family)
MKIDGHTHTAYCFHGSREATEEFILRAIELGFESYSLTEHPPLPSSFKSMLPYPKDVIEGIAMEEKDLDFYIKDMQYLKEKYKNQIQLKVGLEVDFLPEHVDWTRNLLKEFGPYLDDSLLSLHFLQGTEGFHCVDLNPLDFEEGLIHLYGSYEEVVTEYFRVMEEQIQIDLGPYKPKRMGHFTLFQIFQRHFFNSSYSYSLAVNKKIIDLFHLLKDKNYSLDFNMAGFYKPYCQESYPPESIAKLAISFGIELVYGSDSHAVKDVGRGYEFYSNIIREC